VRWVEVNSETDFVAKNEQFQEFVRNVSKLALNAGGDIEALKGATYPGGGTVEEKLTDNIATIGENQSLRRATVIEVGQGVVVSYVHNAVATGLGKIACWSRSKAARRGNAPGPGQAAAMHIAAASPLALNAEGLDPALVERERGIAMEKARESGKPENIIEKKVEGGLAQVPQGTMPCCRSCS
jgi:elongation factor Ts